MSGSRFLDPALPPPAPLEARWVWATVVQSTPLRIQVDGDATSLSITPDDLGGDIVRPVGQRVYCQMLNRQLIVFGGTA